MTTICPPGVGKTSRGPGPTITWAVVVTVIVVVDGPDPLGVTELGEIMQAAPWGAPLQVRLTAWLNPPDGVTVKLNFAGWPAVTGPVTAVAVSEKSTVPLVPVPVRVTFCGLPEELSVTLKVPVRVPEAVGVNVTLMLQFPPAASELPQLLVWPKSPLAAIPAMVSVPLPVLESVTVCAALAEFNVWLANVSELGETLATGVPAAAPVPVRLTVCGLPEELSVTLRLPVRVPAAVGVNFTLMLQFPPAAKELPHVLVWE